MVSLKLPRPRIRGEARRDHMFVGFEGGFGGDGRQSMILNTV